MSKNWILVAVFAALPVLLVVVSNVHGFLAITHRVGANILVVEGWIWNSAAIKGASDEFNRGHYNVLITVGGPIGRNTDGQDESNAALLAARRLEAFGVRWESIVVLPIPDVRLHRTYSSAVRVRKWLNQSSLQITGVNVFTRGAHARKSLVLFQRVLEPAIEVGVIAGTEDDYDPDYWWLSPKGLYFVARKTIGYLYAVLWPFPSELVAPPA